MDRPHARTTIRPIRFDDFPIIIDLWVVSWTRTFPGVDFGLRRAWLAGHLADLRRGGANCSVVASADRDEPVGFVTVHPADGYIDQLTVAVAEWGLGSARDLLDHAKAVRPAGLWLRVNAANVRAIRFYEREGFVRTGEGVSERSGLPNISFRWPGLA